MLQTLRGHMDGLDTRLIDDASQLIYTNPVEISFSDTNLRDVNTLRYLMASHTQYVRGDVTEIRV